MQVHMCSCQNTPLEVLPFNTSIIISQSQLAHVDDLFIPGPWEDNLVVSNT